jgi:hypothetical protein
MSDNTITIQPDNIHISPEQKNAINLLKTIGVK